MRMPSARRSFCGIGGLAIGSQPIGLGATVKLQDWFTNRKIPAGRRRELIVATTARGEIFWVEGERIGECGKLTSATRRRLVWRWERAETT